VCGIAGIIYRDGTRAVGRDMTRMLQSMKHRGPDSTGYALYRPPVNGNGTYAMRLKLADANTPRDFEFHDRLRRHRNEVERRLVAVGAQVQQFEESTEYAFTVTFGYDGDLKALADRVEDVPGAEVLSIGRSLQIIKDLGDAESVAAEYKLDAFEGSHAIGHVRMATESDVDISGAHPYWAYPFADVAVERSGHRFQSECDSEIIAVYLAEKMAEGASLEDAMRQSLEELDGVFTYICVTDDALGMAKDELAAKPLVLYEADDMVALASEEVAIRQIVDREIDTYDPYEGEVMVWQR
jgi:methylamine---glutamate N-methyltransferase subunit A